MAGSLLTAQAALHPELWREYWGTAWHRSPPWELQRLRCFMTASQGRADVNLRGEAAVTDFPAGRRPFLGILTNSGERDPSIDSGVLEYNDDGHLLTIAPTRAGKGTGQIVPNLLLYAGSCLVIDIKGENYSLTHEHRSSFFDGAKTLKFAPFDSHFDRYNPLDFIRVNRDGSPTPDTFDDVRLLAEMLIPSRVDEDFWKTEARGLLTMLILHVATKHRPGSNFRTMAKVTELLFPQMQADEKSPITRTLNIINDAADQAYHSTLKALVTQFFEHEDKVRAGILSTCRSSMSIWLSTRLQDATAASDFSFMDLKRSMCRPVSADPGPTTLYVIIPPEYLKEYRTVLRMMVGLAAVELTRPHEWMTPDHNADGWLPKPPCSVLFILDEFPSLGYMAPIEQGVAYLAGYGVQIWTFAQSIGQLRDIYKENWTTFVANAGAASFFGTAELELSQFLSQQLGNTPEYELRYSTTSQTQGWSFSSGKSDGSSYNFDSGTTYTRGENSSDGDSGSTTIAEQVRTKTDPLAAVSEIRAMPNGLQIILIRNRRPIIAALMEFHRFRLFDELYGTWRT